MTVDNNIRRNIKELMLLQKEDEENDLLQFRSYISAEQYLILYKLFIKKTAQGKMILDWGCGNGHFSYFLLKNGYKVLGTEFERPYLHKELKKLSGEYKFIKISKKNPTVLQFDDNSFDAVSSVGVLEHVRETGGDEIESLKEVKRILKPDGYFFCYHFPNKFSFIELAAKLFPEKHHHQYLYNKNDIKHLCRLSGLELLECKKYGFLPRNFAARLPVFLKESRAVSSAWNLLDRILSMILNNFCQNYFFVAKKRAVL